MCAVSARRHVRGMHECVQVTLVCWVVDASRVLWWLLNKTRVCDIYWGVILFASPLSHWLCLRMSFLTLVISPEPCAFLYTCCIPLYPLIFLLFVPLLPCSKFNSCISNCQGKCKKKVKKPVLKFGDLFWGLNHVILNQHSLARTPYTDTGQEAPGLSDSRSCSVCVTQNQAGLLSQLKYRNIASVACPLFFKWCRL